MISWLFMSNWPLLMVIIKIQLLVHQPAPSLIGLIIVWYFCPASTDKLTNWQTDKLTSYQDDKVGLKYFLLNCVRVSPRPAGPAEQQLAVHCSSGLGDLQTTRGQSGIKTRHQPLLSSPLLNLQLIWAGAAMVFVLYTNHQHHHPNFD